MSELENANERAFAFPGWPALRAERNLALVVHLGIDTRLATGIRAQTNGPLVVPACPILLSQFFDKQTDGRDLAQLNTQRSRANKALAKEQSFFSSAFLLGARRISRAAEKNGEPKIDGAPSPWGRTDERAGEGQRAGRSFASSAPNCLSLERHNSSCCFKLGHNDRNHNYHHDCFLQPSESCARRPACMGNGFVWPLEKEEARLAGCVRAPAPPPDCSSAAILLPILIQSMAARPFVCARLQLRATVALDGRQTGAQVYV